MNKEQIIILWIGISVIVIMGIFPPWVHYGGAPVKARIGRGYKFILTPPLLEKSGRLETIAYLDLPLLGIQWIIVAVIIGGLLVTLKEKKNDWITIKFYCSTWLRCF